MCYERQKNEPVREAREKTEAKEERRVREGTDEKVSAGKYIMSYI